MSYTIDIYVDWNTQDNTGLPWTFLDQAADPSRIRPGAHVVAGHDDAVAVAEIVDIDVDWNTQDDTGLPWTFRDDAVDPSRIVPGAFVVAGRGSAIAVAEVVDVGDDGVVHLRQLPGSVAGNAHRLSTPVT